MSSTVFVSAEELEERLTSSPTRSRVPDAPAEAHLRKYPVPSKTTALLDYLQAHKDSSERTDDDDVFIKEDPPSPGRRAPCQKPTLTPEKLPTTTPPTTASPKQRKAPQSSPSAIDQAEHIFSIATATSTDDVNKGKDYSSAPSVEPRKIHQRANYYKARIHNTWRPGGGAVNRDTDSDDIAEALWSNLADLQFEKPTPVKVVTPTSTAFVEENKSSLSTSQVNIRQLVAHTDKIPQLSRQSSVYAPSDEKLVDPALIDVMKTKTTTENARPLNVSFADGIHATHDLDDNPADQDDLDEDGARFDDLYDYEDYSKEMVNQDMDFFPGARDDKTTSRSQQEDGVDVMEGVWGNWSEFEGLWTEIAVEKPLRPTLGSRLASAPVAKTTRATTTPPLRTQESVEVSKSNNLPRPGLGRMFLRGKTK